MTIILAGLTIFFLQCTQIGRRRAHSIQRRQARESSHMLISTRLASLRVYNYAPLEMKEIPSGLSIVAASGRFLRYGRSHRTRCKIFRNARFGRRHAPTMCHRIFRSRTRAHRKYINDRAAQAIARRFNAKKRTAIR